MSVVSVVCCWGRDLCNRADPLSRGVLLTVVHHCDLETLRMRQPCLELGCCAGRVRELMHY